MLDNHISSHKIECVIRKRKPAHISLNSSFNRLMSRQGGITEVYAYDEAAFFHELLFFVRKPRWQHVVSTAEVKPTLRVPDMLFQ